MLLRRVAPAALVTAAICACEPGVGYDAGRNPQQTNYAVFDPAASPPQIPLPNDLALAQAGSVPGAQGELLKLFVAEEFHRTLHRVRTAADPSRSLGSRASRPFALLSVFRPAVMSGLPQRSAPHSEVIQ